MESPVSSAADHLISSVDLFTALIPSLNLVHNAFFCPPSIRLLLAISSPLSGPLSAHCSEESSTHARTQCILSYERVRHDLVTALLIGNQSIDHKSTYCQGCGANRVGLKGCQHFCLDSAWFVAVCQTKSATHVTYLLQLS